MGSFSGIPRIGIDESGKGDYFGPLVISAVLVKPEDEEGLLEAGVKDSKRLTDGSIAKLSKIIESRCMYSIVRIGPSKYNELYKKIMNLNKLLAWGHSRALENVLDKCPECGMAISDQFGDKSFLENALLKKGRLINLVQMPRAEQDVAVAAASIMARAEFVKAMNALSQEAGISLPKGASDPSVLRIATELAQKGGETELDKYVKLHFKTTKQVLGSDSQADRG